MTQVAKFSLVKDKDSLSCIPNTTAPNVLETPQPCSHGYLIRPEYSRFGTEGLTVGMHRIFSRYRSSFLKRKKKHEKVTKKTLDL